MPDPPGQDPPEQGHEPSGDAPAPPAEDALPPADDGQPSTEDGPEGRHRLTGRARIAVLAGCALVTVTSAVILVRSFGHDDHPAALGGLDAWAPYWALEDSLPELPSRADALANLSPFWFAAERADSVVVDGNAPKEATEAFLASARQAGIRLVPSVVDAMPAGAMAAVLADPAQRSIHVETLARFAAAGDYAGLDIDYEQFAFADDRSTWAATRPAWVAFVTELADRLHADGRTLTVSIPPVYDAGRTSDSGSWVYDYGAIAPVVDHIRVMAYDYSTDSPGPIAPLEWVKRAVEATAWASGDPAKLVLGLPTYGYNWVVSTVGTCPTGEDSGRSGVTARSAEALARRRGATPRYDDVTGEWSFTYQLPLTDGTTSCTQTREVHYVDSDGALARRRLAEEAGFAGGSLWALGYEDDALWSNLAPPG